MNPKFVARAIALLLFLLAVFVGGGVLAVSPLSNDWIIPLALMFGFYSCPVGTYPPRL